MSISACSVWETDQDLSTDSQNIDYQERSEEQLDVGREQKLSQ